MKKFLSIIITALAAFALTGCEQFSTSYQRVDEKKEFRMLKYIWEPADAAPDSTITLTAVFAGKRVDLDNDLQWWVSFNVIRDLLGNTTVVDSTRLEPIATSRLVDQVGLEKFNPEKTQAIEFKFQVPPNIVKTSKSIDTNWANALPRELRTALPLWLTSLKKDEIIDMIESSAANPNSIGAEFSKMLVPILQYFTVPMRVFTKMQGPSGLPHTIISTQNIRYNSRFESIGIPVNHNPVVDRVVVYKVRGSDVGNIDNKSGLSLDSVVLDNTGNSVISVEDGYSYFLDAIATPIDTTITMDGNKIKERHRVYRQFQLDTNETNRVHHSKFMDINNLSGKITMPTDKKITQVTFWLTVYDEAQNERLRPEGGTLVERSARLVYK